MYPKTTALIVIDIIYQKASRDYGNCWPVIDADHGYNLQYFFDRMENKVIPAVSRLAADF